MSDKTGISWTDATWNPVRGCSRVSEGCRNCYAERVAARFSDEGQPYHGLARRVLHVANADERDPGNRSVPRWTGEVRLIPEHLADPLRWKKPRRISPGMQREADTAQPGDWIFDLSMLGDEPPVHNGPVLGFLGLTRKVL